MGAKVMLAVAGAGKTYHICHTINPGKRNLILAFTHENINNIRKELIDAYGEIPKLTYIMTFDSFLFRCFIRPYEPSIGEFFDIMGFRSNGITMKEPPAQTLKVGNRYIANHRYYSKDKIEHYITGNKQYYCSRLSELIMYVSKGKGAFMKRVIKRLNMFFDQILIDEFQDFRKYDYDVLIEMSKSLHDVILVGDYYQHSVSATNNSGKPFKKGKDEISYTSFVTELRDLKFCVDDTTLKKSRRCSDNLCSLVRRKLGINIESSGINVGDVIWITKNEIENVLDNSSVVKLVCKEAGKYTFNAMNWSYSKGNTVSEACVILTHAFDDMDKEEFSTARISNITINKLYVALTRSSGNLFLIKKTDFDQYKERYTRRI